MLLSERTGYTIGSDAPFSTVTFQGDKAISALIFEVTNHAFGKIASFGPVPKVHL